MRPPGRVIDGAGHTWCAARYGDRIVYHPGYLYPGVPEARTFDELAAERPPVRPFGPPSPDSIDRFCCIVRRLIALKPLRRRLVGTLCAALADAAAQAGPAYPLVQEGVRTSHEDAIAAMVTQVAPSLITDPGRFCGIGRDQLADVVLDWVTDPAQYTEPAPVLAELLAVPVALAGGWPAVSDDKLRACPQAALLSWYVSSRIENKPCGGS